MTSNNASQNPTLPSLSYPTILILPSKHRQDEGIRIGLDRLFDDLPSYIKSIRDTYDRSDEVQNDQYWQATASEGKPFEARATTDITSHCDQYALTTPYNRAWKRVTEQVDIEAKLICLEHKLVKYKDPAWRPKDVKSARGIFNSDMKSVEGMLAQLRNDSILYDIWVQVAALDGEKCKKLVENALADDKLHSVGPRKFIRDILQEGKTLFPGASNDIREALKVEVAKHDLEPVPNDSSILPRRKGYFYAFESLVNDRRWISSQTARLERVQEGTKSEALEYMFKLDGQYSAVTCIPSYPTSLFLPVDMRDEEKNEFSARHKGAIRNIEKKRHDMFTLIECDEVTSLNRFSQTLRQATNKAFRLMDQVREERTRLTQAGSEAPPKLQLLMKAWERIRRQIQVESNFILLEQKFAFYTRNSSNVEAMNSRASAKHGMIETLRNSDTSIKKLWEDKDLYDIWVQVGSIDQNAARECKELILETLENEKLKLKDTKPREFIKSLLKPGHALWSNVSAGHAQAIRAALEAEVPNYDLEPDSTRMSDFERKEGNFYAFESLVNDRKWILMHRERLKGIKERLSEIFPDKRRKQDGHGSGSGSGSLSGMKRKPSNNHHGDATKPGKKILNP